MAGKSTSSLPSASPLRFKLFATGLPGLTPSCPDFLPHQFLPEAQAAYSGFYSPYSYRAFWSHLLPFSIIYHALSNSGQSSTKFYYNLSLICECSLHLALITTCYFLNDKSCCRPLEWWLLSLIHAFYCTWRWDSCDPLLFPNNSLSSKHNKIKHHLQSSCHNLLPFLLVIYWPQAAPIIP